MTITLTAGSTAVTIDPARGGAMVAARSQVGTRSVAWLGNADADAVACFPMVPFPSRVRDACFAFAGQTVQLPRNDAPHAIHGHGWLRAWTVVQRTGSRVSLLLEHNAAPDWPWSYAACQTFVVRDMSLSVSMTVRSRCDSAMPLGVGWHPFFPRTPGVTLAANVARQWVMDAAGMPAHDIAPAASLRTGANVGGLRLDTVFSGWAPPAEIRWPEWGTKLRLQASPRLDNLVIYTPPGAAYFCVEPVTQMTDAFNRLARGEACHGVHILPAGGVLRVAMRLQLLETEC